MNEKRPLAKSVFLTAVFAATTFAASFVLGYAITASLGPGTSGIVTIIVTTICIVIGARVVERRWYFTLAVTLFTVFAIPTNLFGPPGVQKILIGFCTGLVYDAVSWCFGRRWFSLPLAAAAATAVSIALIFGLLVVLDHPKKEFLSGILVYIIPMYAVLGFVGGLLANTLYDKRLSKLSVVLQLKD